MIACLAQQLAEKLPHFAEALYPVVKEHGCGAQLTLKELFER
jgi:hypothetical protein